MKLDELAHALKVRPKGQTTLIYGDPKSGKTHLAATMAKVPWIKRIYWFDLEKGSETILTMARQGFFTKEEQDKFEIYRIPDTATTPRAFETIMKVFTSKRKFLICDEHGKADCMICKSGRPFELASLNESDLIVLDSGSQLADSVLNYYCQGKPLDFKPGWDEYGAQGRVLSDFLSIVQQAQCNYIVCTHILAVEEGEGDKKRDRYYPLLGTKNFSMRVAKFFDHVVLCNLNVKRHAAGSSTSYKSTAITGSRLDLKMEKVETPDFSLVFKLLQEENEALLKVLQANEVQSGVAA